MPQRSCAPGQKCNKPVTAWKRPEFAKMNEVVPLRAGAQIVKVLDATPRDSRLVKLKCSKVWKVFGANAAEFLAARGGTATAAELADGKLIGAVRDATIEVREGEIFIVMGLSGSGKSTLLRCMSRLIEPTSGIVEVDGKDLMKASAEELIEIRRNKMGMVFQHFALLPHLTVLENIAFPLSIQGVDSKTKDERARVMVQLVGLKGREKFYPRELSGGQQQRVGIARSLAVKPQIWFLDEPFSALDPLIRRDLQSELIALQSILKKTILFVTHDFDEAIRLGDRIAIMKDGEIIQVGTPEDLVLHPATSYVAEFTRDVARAKVMSAGRLMRPVVAGAVYGRHVNFSDKIASFAADIVMAKTPFGVLEGSGSLVGEITPEAVIDLLAGCGLASEARR